MKSGRTLQELAIEIDRQAKTKRDYLVETPALRMVPENSRFNLSIDGLDDLLNINNVAHRQIGTQLGIPAKYYDKMRTEYPQLLVENVNGWWLQKEPERRMIRTLDGTARAYLSDKYRRIDNLEVAETVLPIIGNMDGATIESCELTDYRMYIKVVNSGRCFVNIGK